MSIFDTKPSPDANIAVLDAGMKQVSWTTSEALHGTQRNRWKNWYCSAGERALYIDFDGNLFVGTCRVGGWFGNIFMQNPDTPFKMWVKCTVETCQCGSDMKVPKVKYAELLPESPSALYQKVEASGAAVASDVSEPVFIAGESVKDYKMITWDIGRRCNYSCSYCFPDSHNNFETPKSLGSLKHAVDFLRRHWSKGSKMKFVIAGGEPTVIPHYLE
ncbi:MAG TPA: hypothetical protein VFV50_14460, partial [Bdellovibrionales bacterium]|nr:hypothetical protein [Bdellovibrionales bacterium]